MTVSPVGQPNSRYSLELRRVSDNGYLGTVPFKDLQAEWRLGADGAAVRCSVPYRGDYDWITPDILWPGKTELWVRDSGVLYNPWGRTTTNATDNIIFAGPILDITANSGEGTLSLAASNYLFYLKKRILRNNLFWPVTGSGRELVSNMMYYMNGAPPQPTWNFKLTPGQPDFPNTFDMTTLYPASDYDIRYAGTDMITGLDLLDDVSQVSDFEYFMQLARLVMSNAGGFVDPNPPMLLTFGAADAERSIANYSFTVQAESMANLFYAVSGPYVHSQIDNVAMAEYGTMYQDVDNNGSAVTDVDNQRLANTRLKTTARAAKTPQLVFRSYDMTPFRTFYYGQVMNVQISDGWVQYSDKLRVTGFQLTINTSGDPTTTVYTNDMSGVSA